jgi:hypothetical protein
MGMACHYYSGKLGHWRLTDGGLLRDMDGIMDSPDFHSPHGLIGFPSCRGPVHFGHLIVDIWTFCFRIYHVYIVYCLVYFILYTIVNNNVLLLCLTEQSRRLLWQLCLSWFHTSLIINTKFSTASKTVRQVVFTTSLIAGVYSRKNVLTGNYLSSE